MLLIGRTVGVRVSYQVLGNFRPLNASHLAHKGATLGKAASIGRSSVFMLELVSCGVHPLCRKRSIQELKTLKIQSIIIEGVSAFCLP